MPDNGALRQKVEDHIQRLLDANAPLAILGDQAHIVVPLTPIPRVLEIWDDWIKNYRKPIKIIEFDVNVADDAIHEKYVRDFVTAAFYNPNIESFLKWGFWSKTHWIGESGDLFRANSSPRPAALTFEDLVINQWRTNQVLTTDKAGTAKTRGFLGDYEVQVTAAGETTTAQIFLKSVLQKAIVLP